jgi:hypothetical protein
VTIRAKPVPQPSGVALQRKWASAIVAGDWKENSDDYSMLES